MSIQVIPEELLLEGLPGGDLILRGLQDLRAGRETVEALLVEALLVEIVASRLREGGLAVPTLVVRPVDAEIRLYRLLGSRFGCDAYGQYNSFLRRLSSLCRALDGRVRRFREKAKSVPLASPTSGI